MSNTAFAAALVIGFNVAVAMLITGLWVIAVAIVALLGLMWYNQGG